MNPYFYSNFIYNFMNKAEDEIFGSIADNLHSYDPLEKGAEGIGGWRR